MGGKSILSVGTPYNSSADDNFNIYVKKLTGESNKINIGIDESVYRIRTRVEKMLNMPQIKLNYQKTTLDDWKTAKEVGLTADCTVHLLL